MNTSPRTTFKTLKGAYSSLCQGLLELINECQDPKMVKKLEHVLETLENLENYTNDTSSPETEIQRKLREDTMAEPWEEHFKAGRLPYKVNPLMMSGSPQGQFLQMIAEITKAKQILEIGMFTGYSAVSFCGSLYAEQVTTLDNQPFFENFFKERISGNKEIEKKLKLIQGPALESLKTLKNEGQKFDLVFIDADKPNYINYYNFILENSMLEPNGCIMADDSLFGVNVLSKDNPSPSESSLAIYKFNEHVKNDERVFKVNVPIRFGISFIKLKSGFGGEVDHVKNGN